MRAFMPALIAALAIATPSTAATPYQKQAAGRAFAAAGGQCSYDPRDMQLVEQSGKREVYATVVLGIGGKKTCVAVCEDNRCSVSR